MKRLASWYGLTLLLALGACSEKPQGMTTPKADTQAYMGAQDPFVLPGWKPGDKASWQEQLRKRAQSQNEYLRLAAQ